MRFVFLEQRHEDALRHRVRRRLGRLHRRLRDEDSRLPGHHRLRVGRLARDSQPARRKTISRSTRSRRKAGIVAHPDLTVAETQRLKRNGKALDEFLDKISQASGGSPCPIMLTVRGRLATPRPMSPTSSRSRARRTRRAPFSPCACSRRPARDAIFSNAIDHAIVVRRVTVAGVGNAAKFQPADDEIRFSFRFGALQRDAAGNVSPDAASARCRAVARCRSR